MDEVPVFSTSETLIPRDDTPADDMPLNDTLSHEEAYAMTVDILVAITIDRLVAFEEIDPEEPNYDALVDAVHDEALVREAGFSLFFLRGTLRPIVADVHDVAIGEEFDLGLTGEYIYLRFMYPDSTQEELLLLFRESVEREEERIQTIHLVVLEKVSEERSPQFQ